MSAFQKWLCRSVEAYGFDNVCHGIKADRPALKRWLSGVSEPKISYQYLLSKYFEVDLGYVRGLLGLNSSPVQEWLVEKVMAIGGTAKFCERANKAGVKIGFSLLCKYMDASTVPTMEYTSVICIALSKLNPEFDLDIERPKVLDMIFLMKQKNKVLEQNKTSKTLQKRSISSKMLAQI